MEYIYKTLKYGTKSENYQLLLGLNSKNPEQLYKLLKHNYTSTKILSQKGGGLISTNNELDVVLRHVVFHGSMANNKLMKIPEHMYMFMPLCCGFIVMNSLDEFEYFKGNEPDIITKLNDNVNAGVLKVGRKNYIVLKPNDEYCDIEIAFVFDIFLEEGIFTNDTKLKNFNYLDYLVNELITYASGKYGFDQIVNIHNLLLLTAINNDALEKQKQRDIIKDTTLEHQNKIQHDNINNNISDDILKQKEKSMHYDHILEQIIPHQKRLILLLNVYKNDIQQKINETYLEYFTNLVTLLKSIGDFYFDDELKKIKKMINPKNLDLFKKENLVHKIVELYSSIGIMINGINNTNNTLNDVNLIFNFTQMKKFKDSIKQIYVSDIIADICNDIYTQHIPINISVSNKESVNWETDVGDIFFIAFGENDFIYDRKLYISDLEPSGQKKLIGFNYVMYSLGDYVAKLCKLAVMPELTKTFLGSKYFNSPAGQVKIYLSDVLNYLSIENKKILPNAISFIVNKSCQGFQEDSGTCTVSKCFSSMLQKLNPTLSTENDRGTFDQRDLNILVSIITKIFELDHYKTASVVTHEHKNTFFSLQCILHDIQITDPDIIAKAFLYYSNITYPHLLDHLKYTLENEHQDKYVWKEIQIKVIIAVLNLFITDVYFKLIDNIIIDSSNAKTTIDDLMGSLKF